MRTRIAYGAPAFAMALFGVPVFVHLPRFYADVAGAPIGALGAAILLTRLWDAALDPVIGAWSDRAETRWGRRRPFIAAGAAPLALAVALLMAPPALGPAGAVAWFTVTMAAGFLAWTTVQIPYAALGPELETGHHERTALFAVRDGLWMAGTLVAAAMPALLRAVLPDGAGERAVFGWMGAIYGSLIVALAWGAVAVLRERPPAARTTAPAPPWRVAREALANRPFRILLAAYAIGALGGALPGTLIFFFVEHVLAAPELGDLFLALYFLVGFACLPAWTWLARRVGKKPAFLAAMGLSVAVFSAAFLLGPGDTLAYGAVVVLSGTGFGAGLVLPASMQADTLDLDELRSGARREGVYLGLWSVVMKSSAAIGAGAGLTVLGWAGYAGTGTPPEPALLAIRVLYCLVPCACYLAALVVAARYPLDEAACRRIRDELDARNTRPPQAAPVA